MQPIKNEEFSIAVDKDNAEPIFLALVGLGYQAWPMAQSRLEERRFFSASFHILCYDCSSTYRGETVRANHFETFSAFLDWHFDKQEKQKQKKSLTSYSNRLKCCRNRQTFCKLN